MRGQVREAALGHIARDVLACQAAENHHQPVKRLLLIRRVVERRRMPLRIVETHVGTIEATEFASR